MRDVLVATPTRHLPDVRVALSRLGRVSLLDTFSRDVVLSHLPSRALFVNPNAQSFFIDAEIIRSVEIICTASTGTDHIDVEAANRMGVRVISLRDDPIIYKLPGTAELALSLTLAIIRNISTGWESVKGGNWNYLEFMGHEFQSLTVGVLGLGRLGSMYAQMCRGIFGEVIAYDTASMLPQTFPKMVDFDSLLSQSDVLSIHVHHDSSNHHLIGKSEINRMLRNPYLINTSRGGIVDEDAIGKAVLDRNLRGYAADVIEDEYALDDVRSNSLVQISKEDKTANLIITPHVGGMTYEGQSRAWLVSVNKLEQALK
jgi:D-3-phosphoglycerate dehydrogenase